MEPVLSVKKVSVGHADATLARDVSFDVHPGEILMIMGSSGCGKSTLLRSIVGLQRPQAGKIYLNGVSLWEANQSARAQVLVGMGVMFQTGALFGSKTLVENVRLPLEHHTQLPMDAMNALAMQKLAWVGLQDDAHRLPSEISGGMQKRAGIARAMVLDPELLFFDEPGAGLDPITAKELDLFLVDLAKQLAMTFVVVSHELASVFRIATRVVMLDKASQSVVADGAPDDLKAHSDHPLVQQLLNGG